MQATRLPLQLLLQRSCLVCGDHDMGKAVISGPRTCMQLRLPIFAKLLEARIGAQWIPDWIKSQ
jgi:hypothetical protein